MTLRAAAQAYRKVRTAIARGGLIRPSKCDRCGKESRPASDGRSTIHAHHHDYAKPLVVSWLCAKCHRMETPIYDKSSHPNTKLSDALVLLIRSSHLSSHKLAPVLGVNPTTIQRARNGVHWKTVSPAAAEKETK